MKFRIPWFSRAEKKTIDASNLTWSALLGESVSSKSGAAVTVDTALKVTTVFACLRVLGNSIAQVPVHLYTKDGKSNTRKLITDDPVARLLSSRPNSFMTAFEWKQMAQFHATLCGVHVSVKNVLDGQVRELLPLTPGTFVLKQDASMEPYVELQKPFSDGKRILTADQLFILRGPMWCGASGMSALELAREAIGLAIATEQTHSAMHANGVMPGGVLSMKGQLDDAAKERLKKDWQAHQVGLNNKFRTVVLDMDAKWEQMTMSGVDSQHLETRRFQIEEICRDLGVFPHMIGYSDKTATFASAEAFFQAYVTHNLTPWIVNWEQALALYLFPDKPEQYVKFNLRSLLRGNADARAAYYTSGITNGWLTRNEARALEDFDPLDGLDEPLVPLNMGTQADVAAAAQDVAKAVGKMLGHNGGPSLDENEMAVKIGRVLSARNEKRIRDAHQNLGDVLNTLPSEEGE